MLVQPFARRRVQALVRGREPPPALGRMIEEDVPKPAESTAPVEGDLQPLPQPRVVHGRGELRHPAVLDGGSERLDVDYVPRRQPVINVLLPRPRIVGAEAVDGDHFDLAAPYVEIAGPFARGRGEH